MARFPTISFWVGGWAARLTIAMADPRWAGNKIHFQKPPSADSSLDDDDTQTESQREISQESDVEENQKGQLKKNVEKAVRPGIAVARNGGAEDRCDRGGFRWAHNGQESRRR